MDNTSSTLSDSAAAGIAIGVILVYVVIIVAAIAFGIWMYWRIFTKAGYNGALAFLNFIPGVGQLICLLILAFGRWPMEDQMAALGAGRANPAPGSSIQP